MNSPDKNTLEEGMPRLDIAFWKSLPHRAGTSTNKNNNSCSFLKIDTTYFTTRVRLSSRLRSLSFKVMHFVWKPSVYMTVPKGNVLEISADIFPSNTANKRGKVNLHGRKGHCSLHESSVSSHMKRSNHSIRMHILLLICFILAKNADYYVWFLGWWHSHCFVSAFKNISEVSVVKSG